jgi:ABC-type Mn2+/Zn2+ transport system ATPase subunit
MVHTHPFSYGGRCTMPPDVSQPALKITDVSFRYPGTSVDALKGINFTLEPGERVALVGPNGSGKSTLLKLIIGLEQLRSGSIMVYGHSAASCRHRAAIVPQRAAVDWQFPVTVRQVVMMGRYVHLGWTKRPRPADVEAVDKAMEMMKIVSLANRQVGELSGGQQQRVMIARTLAHDADLLLLDEPLNHVDLTTQELIFHTIEALSLEGKTAIVSTHDLGLLPVHFSRALFIDGTIIADGEVSEVLTPETIARAYGLEYHGHLEEGAWLHG